MLFISPTNIINVLFLGAPGMARGRLSALRKRSRLHFIIWHFTVHHIWVWEAKLKSMLLCSAFQSLFFVSGYMHAHDVIWQFLAWLIRWMSSCCSYSRWKMWAWECGWSNSTVQDQCSIYTAWSSASLGALKIITQHITNLQDKWHACGTNCSLKERPSAATWDDNESIWKIAFAIQILQF